MHNQRLKVNKNPVTGYIHSEVLKLIEDDNSVNMLAAVGTPNLGNWINSPLSSFFV